MEPVPAAERMGRLDRERLRRPVSQAQADSDRFQSNQKAVVYNLALSPSLSVSPIEHTLHAHTRAVTDINWSPAAPEILATCGLDGWVWSWDLRTGYGSRSGAGGGRKPVWGVSSWGCEYASHAGRSSRLTATVLAGATQVKWNRREPHLIASAHDNRVMIWDDRVRQL